jgi:hypothetical protein
MAEGVSEPAKVPEALVVARSEGMPQRVGAHPLYLGDLCLLRVALHRAAELRGVHLLPFLRRKEVLGLRTTLLSPFLKLCVEILGQAYVPVLRALALSDDQRSALLAFLNVLGAKRHGFRHSQPAFEHDPHKEVIAVRAKIAVVRLLQKALRLFFGQHFRQPIRSRHRNRGVMRERVNVTIMHIIVTHSQGKPLFSGVSNKT